MFYDKNVPGAEMKGKHGARSMETIDAAVQAVARQKPKIG
jgi:hypothetical protein